MQVPIPTTTPGATPASGKAAFVNASSGSAGSVVEPPAPPSLPAAAGSPDLSHAAHHHAGGYLPMHRVEMLTDGIFAVAMTLLVIELKLPADHAIHSAEALQESLAELIFKGIAWINSFFVLSLFWIGHTACSATCGESTASSSS